MVYWDGQGSSLKYGSSAGWSSGWVDQELDFCALHLQVWSESCSSGSTAVWLTQLSRCAFPSFGCSWSGSTAAQPTHPKLQNSWARTAAFLTCWFVSKAQLQCAAVLSVLPLVSYLHVRTCAVCVGVQVKWVNPLRHSPPITHWHSRWLKRLRPLAQSAVSAIKTVALILFTCTVLTVVTCKKCIWIIYHIPWHQVQLLSFPENLSSLLNSTKNWAYLRSKRAGSCRSAETLVAVREAPSVPISTCGTQPQPGGGSSVCLPAANRRVMAHGPASSGASQHHSDLVRVFASSSLAPANRSDCLLLSCHQDGRCSLYLTKVTTC